MSRRRSVCRPSASGLVTAGVVALALFLTMVNPRAAGAQGPAVAPATELPDLQVQAIYPDFYPSGYGFLGQVHIYNAGTASADSFTVRLMVDGVVVGYAKVNGVLAQNSEDAFFSNLNGLGAPPVTHSIRAVLDVFGHVAESNEGNNDVTEPLYIDAPNLVVDHISPDTIHVGQSANFTLWVRNTGASEAPATVTYFAESYPVPPGGFSPKCPEIPTPAIPPGGLVSVACAAGTVTPATSYRWYVCVDHTELVPEEYEQNCEILGVVVAGPDLVIDHIAPDQAVPGQPFTATAYVRNQGLDPAGASTTRVRLVGGSSWNLATPALAAGQTTSVSCTIPAQAAGTVTLEATADVGGVVTERYEDNNVRSEPVEIAIADLVVSRIRVSQVWSGIPITVYVTVRNQGSATAPASSTILSADGTTRCATIATPSLMAGDSAVVTCSAGSFSQALHTFAACADIGGVVPEGNEGNNCLTASVRFWTTIPIHVRADGTGDYPTIQAAIDAASDYGAVELADGTYTGTGNRDVSFNGKKIRVYSASGVPIQCVVNCQATSGDNHRGFLFNHAEDSTSVLEGIRIRYGYHVRGAGIYCQGSAPQLRNLLVDHCTSSTDGGAGILLDGASPTIEDCTFEYCTANAVGGGGLYAHDYASPRLTSVSFRKCQSVDRGGGALFSVNCFPTLQYCFFDYNSGVNGGGLTFVYAFGPVRDCLFSNNSAQYGGGMQCYGNAQATIERCTFYGNDGKDCSGIYCRGSSSPTINNTIVSHGLGSPALVRYASDCNPTLSCTDLWMNDDGAGDWTGFVAGQRTLRGNRSDDPLFCAVSSDDFTLRGASPCAPENSGGCGQIGRFGVGCNRVVTVRADGSGDYATIQAAIDASENGGVIQLADGQYRGAGNRDIELRGKRLTIRSASGCRACVQIDPEGSVATPHRAFYVHGHEDSLTILKDFTIARGYAVDGGGILIDGASPRLENLAFDACHATDEGGALCAVDSCNSVITNVAVGSCVSDNDGGGMCFLTWSSPRLTSCGFWSNHAADRGGGVLFSVNCFPILSGCRFDGNQAGSGGGLMFAYAFGPVSNTLFVGNQASVEGGGLHCYGNGQATVDGCTFFDNAAPLGGGIYCRNSSSPTIQRTVIAGTDQGGAIGRLETNNNPTLSCTDLWANVGGSWSGFVAGQAGLRWNLEENPLFCDTLGYNFEVDAHSRCLAEHNSCVALIGAYGEGCAVIGLPQPEIPAAFFARPNAPNPFRASTRIRFGLPEAGRVTLRVYDVAGRVVCDLVAGARLDAGVHEVAWDGRDADGVRVRAGIYFYRLAVDGRAQVRRMVVVR
jgi:pectin methylesterase-like acyl-CoA thioesterase